MKKRLFFSAIATLMFFNQLKSQADTIQYVSYADSLPTFLYGQDQFTRFIQINQVYPQEARKIVAQGKVYISFVVDTLGRVSNTKILKDIGGGCGAEAVKVIEQTSGMWKPGIDKGKKANVQITLPMKFTCENCSSDMIFNRNTDPAYMASYIYNRAIEDLEANRLLLSIFYFTKALSLIPDYKDCYNKRGVAKLKNNDKKGACEDWMLAQKSGDKKVRDLIDENCK